MALNRIIIRVEPGSGDSHLLDAIIYARVTEAVCHAAEAGFQAYNISKKPMLLVDASKRQGSIEWDILWMLYEGAQNFGLVANAIRDGINALSLSLSYLKGRNFGTNEQSTQLAILDENGAMLSESKRIRGRQAQVLEKKTHRDAVEKMVSISNQGNIGALTVNVSIEVDGQKQDSDIITGNDIADCANIGMRSEKYSPTIGAEQKDILAVVRRVDFDEGLWKFSEYDGRNIFFGSIDDAEYLEKVHERKISFSDGTKVIIDRQYVQGRTFRISKIRNAGDLLE